MRKNSFPSVSSVLLMACITGAGNVHGDTIKAVPTSDFLASIGVCSTFPDRGQPIDKTIEMVRYCGFRWVRGGIEGLSKNGPTTVDTYLQLHKATGVKFSWGLVSGGTDIAKLIESARILAKAGALFAFEGNNEPNNWGVTYQGEKGGGHNNTNWLPVAKVQRDMYAAVKSDPLLCKYPVWSISESGGQLQNVGLQFLTIPEGAGTDMPDGTKFADYVNVHNYVYHPNSPHVEDNKTWNASDPGPACRIDGLYGNHGRTWARGYKGYSKEELETIPKVTTETGMTIGGDITEEIHGLNLLSLYLAQFKRGWSYTSVYILRDRTDEGGNQKFGFFAPDYTPRKAAVYLHNFTTIIDDDKKCENPGELEYTIENRNDTVHDLLLRHSSGDFQLIVWGESVNDKTPVEVKFGEKFPVVEIFNPVEGTRAVGRLTDVSSVKLVMSDHPYVLKLTK